MGLFSWTDFVIGDANYDVHRKAPHNIGGVVGWTYHTLGGYFARQRNTTT